MRTILQDFSYGVRLMRRNPGFTAAAVATLALGIGANTALFSIINVLTLKPLAYRDPERVVFVRGYSNQTQTAGFSLPVSDFVEIGRRATTLEKVTTYSYWSANLTGGATPEREAWRSLGLNEDEIGVKALRIEHTRRFGEQLLEVAAPVLGEDGEVLGTVRYGLSTKRMRDALGAARAESER